MVCSGQCITQLLSVTPPKRLHPLNMQLLQLPHPHLHPTNYMPPTHTHSAYTILYYKHFLSYAVLKLAYSLAFGGLQLTFLLTPAGTSKSMTKSRLIAKSLISEHNYPNAPMISEYLLLASACCVILHTLISSIKEVSECGCVCVVVLPIF